MAEEYTVRVEARFEAAHNLRKYKGVSEPLHGHSWKVETKFKCTKLDPEGIGIDYAEAERTIRELAKRFDHRYINEIPPFDKMNPTSENLARWFFGELEGFTAGKNAHVSEVIVWEGPESYAAFSKTN